MRESLRNLEARRSGLERNIADYRKDISSLESDLRSSGSHSDAYERQQAIGRKISERNRDIDNTKSEARPHRQRDPQPRICAPLNRLGAPGRPQTKLRT